MIPNKSNKSNKAISKLAKVVLVILLLAIPAYCCEVYIRNEAGEYILTIDNVTNVGVCDLNLTYDSDLVDITDVIGESFDYFDYNRIDLGDGKNVLRTQAFQINNPGLSGLIDYAILKLHINGNEQGEIDIGVIEIVEDSPEVKPIPHTVRNFAVSEPPFVTVNSPDGGENWKAGTAAEIRWTATDNIGVTSVDIAYSTDDGATYQTIATGIPDSGAYNWTIPAAPSSTCLVKVIAHDVAGNAGEAVSGATFTITAAPSTTPTTVTSHRSSGGEGTYPPGWGATPTAASTSAAHAVTPAAAPVEVATPAGVAATPEPVRVTEFRTEPKSLPPPILTPIAGIVIVVIASIMGGIVKVISLTTAHPEPAGRETEGGTGAEAIAPAEERHWKKSLAAIVGIVVIAVVAIIVIAVV